MKRQIFVLMSVLIFAMSPFLGMDQMVDANNGENDNGDVSSSADLITLVEQFEDEGEITDESAVHALKIHLTAVSHFEKQETTKKVVKHLQGLQLLLDHQQADGLLSEQAYDTLSSETDTLLAQWDSLIIVRDGEANAVVVVSEDTVINKRAPHWGTWTNYGGNSELVLGPVHTGQASLSINDMKQGGLSQVIDVQPGPVTAQVYYYTHAENEAKIRIGMNLRDEGDNNLSAISSDTILTSATAGEWVALTVQGDIPVTVDDKAVTNAQVFLTIEDGEDTSVYVDDYLIYQEDENHNLLQNPGFEQINIEHDAATSLVNYVKKSTGIELPVVEGEPSDSEGIKIYIGESRTEDEVRHQELLQDLNEHGYIIDPQEDTMTILGTTDRATEYGVYEFLERYVGVRWLMPGPDGEHVPQQSTLSIPRELVQEEPATVSRHFFGMRGEGVEWAKHNRMHHNIQFHHNMDTLFDPEVFADHPEYYADGEIPTHRYSWQPCFNDETAEAAIERIIAYFDDNPEASSYSLGINDGTNYCEDPGHPDYPTETNSVGKLHRSDLYYRWVNQIAEGVTAVHPDKYFGLLAYREMYDPPKNEDGTPYQLHPNVVPYITDDRMSWIDPPMGDAGAQHTENWQEAAENLGWYEYLYGSPYNVPRVYMHKMAENYQYANDHDVIGHVAELYPNFGEGPKPWISAKLQWDPTQDVDALLQEWYVTAVGEEAAPYLQQYYEHWEEFWTTRIFESKWYQDWAGGSSRSNYLRHREEGYLEAVTKEDVIVSRGLLEQAVAEAETDEQKTRAESLLRSFEYYEASVLSYPRNDTIEPPTTQQEALELLDDIILSVEMAEKRETLLEEFEGDPILDRPGVSGVWDGVQIALISALQSYVKTEEDEVVGEQLDQFLKDISYYNLSTNAVKTTASKEEIVGSLDFSAGPWADAEPFSNFFVMNTTDEPPVETKVYLLWDDENLYVGYENFDDDLSQMIVSDDAPNGWWGSGGDDSVETYVTDDPSEPFLGFFTNPNGVKFARYQSSGDQDIEWSARAQIGDDRWNTVQVIPFASIDVDPRETTSLRGFFFRNYHGHDAFLGWEGGAPWKPESFRIIDLVGQPVAENSSFETGNSNAPPWGVWQNYGGTGERVEGIAHSGKASFMFDSMKEGGLSQVIDVQPGPFQAQLHYYTPGISEGPVQLNFGFNLKDASGNKQASIDSDKITIVSTADEWSAIELVGEVPATVNNVKIEEVQLFVTVRDNFETKVYIDDFNVYQMGE